MKPWLGLLVLVSLIPACSRARNPNEDVLKIGAYSVVREVLHDGVLPAFIKAWKTKTGREVTFEESYTGSGARPERFIGI